MYIYIYIYMYIYIYIYIYIYREREREREREDFYDDEICLSQFQCHKTFLSIFMYGFKFFYNIFNL